MTVKLSGALTGAELDAGWSDGVELHTNRHLKLTGSYNGVPGQLFRFSLCTSSA